MVEIFSSRLGPFGKPWKQQAARHVMHADARLGLGLATYWLTVPCMRSGGLRFSFQGNRYWLLVYVMNAAGGGDIASMWVKGTRSGWIKMSHNWGASYQAFATLKGQALCFRLTSCTSKETMFAWNVAPSNWNVGLTYKSNANFH
ncbi:expansin-A7-like [Pyrus ussuriensis x Pyrus communis]|uniref:Expansin n=1 Tax=Pyrus ussuriensis x Pyrus communis TaxID=2448454 RepID=A0A5N5I2K2_9ROSA|nr:expansin-A7-like [Pyrus ussuriensis x Pyrus communis]